MHDLFNKSVVCCGKKISMASVRLLWNAIQHQSLNKLKPARPVKKRNKLGAKTTGSPSSRNEERV